MDLRKSQQERKMLPRCGTCFNVSSPLDPSETEGSSKHQLTAWRYAEHTPSEWIGLLDQGLTIATGQFVTADDGEYHHRKGLWKGTRLICCDGDVIRGVDYDKHGIDEHPEGVEPFTDPQRLIELYPTLEDEAFALGHSSLITVVRKPPTHVRARISFLTESKSLSKTITIFLPGYPPSIPSSARLVNRRNLYSAMQADGGSSEMAMLWNWRYNSGAESTEMCFLPAESKRYCTGK